jgi:hypothetical protein
MIATSLPQAFWDLMKVIASEIVFVASVQPFVPQLVASAIVLVIEETANGIEVAAASQNITDFGLTSMGPTFSVICYAVTTVRNIKISAIIVAFT